MSNLDIVKQAILIPSTHQWDDLYDLLLEDFIFRTPLRTIVGRKKFIDFEKSRLLLIHETSLYLFSDPTDQLYYHINKIEFPDTGNKSIISQQRITLEGNKIKEIMITGEKLSKEIIKNHYPELAVENNLKPPK